MKKLIYFVLVMLSVSVTAYAGSIPEDLLSSDNAQIFFAEVKDVYYPDGEKPYVEVLPWKIIKGEVTMHPEIRVVYYNPNEVGDFKVKRGENYLFTYFDENNPTDIFQVTSYDTSTLKLKNVQGDMWKRFEQYLNEGRYLEAEQERVNRKNASIPLEGDDVLLSDLIGVKKEDAKTVSIHYCGKVYDLDAHEFYKAIDGVYLKNIEDVSLQDEKKKKKSGMYILVNGFDGYAYITDGCKVDKYGMHYSSMPVGAYTIDVIDKAKITALFAEDDLPFQETDLAKKICYVVLLLILFAVGFAVGRKRKW